MCSFGEGLHAPEVVAEGVNEGVAYCSRFAFLILPLYP